MPDDERGETQNVPEPVEGEETEGGEAEAETDKAEE